MKVTLGDLVDGPVLGNLELYYPELSELVLVVQLAGNLVEQLAGNLVGQLFGNLVQQGVVLATVE